MKELLLKHPMKLTHEKEEDTCLGYA